MKTKKGTVVMKKSVFAALACVPLFWSATSSAGSMSVDVSNSLVSIVGKQGKSLAAELAALIAADENATTQFVQGILITDGELGSSSDYGDEISVTIALDGDLLAVGGKGSTRVLTVGGAYAEKLSKMVKATVPVDASFPRISCVTDHGRSTECLLTDLD